MLLVLVSSMIAVLTGCLYRGEQQQGRPATYTESVDRIQRALERYQEEQGILPIVTAGEETPRYEKYRIDLNQMKQLGYLEEIPAAAFEQGGGVYFLVIDEETDPSVKALDLGTVQKVNDVQRRVDGYKSSHGGELPGQAAGETYPGLYTVDLPLLKAEDYALQSVYSGETLPYLMDAAGHVYADYAFDIMQAIEQAGKTPLDDEDLRTRLTDSSDYVPVKSLPYRWVDGTPVPQISE
ncbi:hypothetical protein [Paenibacillus macerans]|uniref:hypothetical protein n=1 Tax=Paenibacillus macerans TaxID=44252 RepID=UPI003D320524